MAGYTPAIQHALRREPNVTPSEVGVVEELMRLEAGGCLDHLPRPEFDRLARECLTGARDLAAVDPACYEWYARCAA